MINGIKIKPCDNVAIATEFIEKGFLLRWGVGEGSCVVCVDPIPEGHKVALCDIVRGSDVIKGSFEIGMAAIDIALGSHVHSHNVLSRTES